MTSAKNNLLFFCFGLLFACNAPQTPKSSQEEDTSKMEEAHAIRKPDCIYKRTEKTQSATYPFNQADKILLVAYPPRKDSYTNDTLIVSGAFTVKPLEEEVVLTTTQTDTLFHILYDYRSGSEDVRPVADCYNPRHALVFYKKNKAIAFLEVCLDCGGRRQTRKLDFGDLCEEKNCMLQALFKKAGVKYGIMDEICR